MATLGIKLTINQMFCDIVVVIFVTKVCGSIVNAGDLRTVAVMGGDLSKGESLMPSTMQTNDHTGAGNNSGHSRSTYYSPIQSKSNC